MAITFPTTLDNFTNPTPTDSVATLSHAEQHSNHNDAIEALEAKVGIDGSADTNSLDYKVAQLEASQEVYAQQTEPSTTGPALWIQTGLGSGNDVTLWAIY